MSRKLNGPFAAVPIWAIDLITKKGNPTHSHILMCIIRLTPFDGNPIMTIDDISGISGLSPSTVKRSIKWLELHKVVTSTILSANRGKSIIVNYRKPKGGFTSDLALRKGGVTSDLPTPKGGVTSDLPGGSPVNPPRGCEQGERVSIDSTLDIVQRKMSNDIFLCGLRPKKQQGEPMPTFGADPDNDRPWDETIALKKTTSEVSQVLDHFELTARRVGGKITPTGERPAFRAQIKRLINAGVKVPDLTKMTEEFFALSRNIESPAPWRVFCSREVQTGMMSKMTGVSQNSPILGWVSDDFQHGSDLPWDEDINQKMQKIIWRRGMDVAYRYPELLVGIAEVAFEDISFFDTLIQSASFLITNCTTVLDNELAPVRSILTDAGIAIPEDILARKNLRELAPSLKQAVVNYQLTRRTTT